MRCRSRGARVAIATGAAASWFLSLPPFASAITIRTVAITGEVAPGAAGATYSTFGAPVLNESGDTAFTALLQQGGGVDATNDLGAWSEASATLGLVARRGSAAPGTGGASYQSFISPPVMNESGELAFRGFLQTGGPVTTSNNEGIWSQGSGSLGLVGREGDQGAGVPAGQTYASSFSNPSFNDAGQVAYNGSLVGGGTTTADNRALWAGGPGAPSLVARKGDVAAGVGDGALYQSFSGPVINGAGDVAFRGILDVGDFGIWSGSPGSLSLVAREGTAAAGVAGATYGTLQSPDLNDAGRLAFSGLMTQGVGGVTAADDGAVWAGSAGSISLVAREGDAAPGGGSFESFLSPVLSSSGVLSFRASITGGTGIYVGDESSLSKVAASGDVAPFSDLGLGDATFSAFVAPEINAVGQVVFEAFLAGLGVTADNDEALYAMKPSGNLALIVREGDVFQRRPGDFAVITEIDLVTGSDSLGRSANANGLGEVAFHMTFLDGGEGVFVATIPEPGTAALLALGLAGLALRRRASA